MPEVVNHLETESQSDDESFPFNENELSNTAILLLIVSMFRKRKAAFWADCRRRKRLSLIPYSSALQ